MLCPTEEGFDPVPIPFGEVATEPSGVSRDGFPGSPASGLATEASNAGQTIQHGRGGNPKKKWPKKNSTNQKW